MGQMRRRLSPCLEIMPRQKPYIKELGFTYTFLRDNFYLDFLIDMALENGEIRGPAGSGLVSAVARKDTSKVAAEILLNPKEWENQSLNLTGPEDLSMEEIVALLSKETGKDITYLDESVEEAYESRKKWPAQTWEYDAWVSTYTAIKSWRTGWGFQQISKKF